ncbi:COMM domain-containing protein 10 [Erpetoichthys calabaricus]|uniref:COMM domain containing 10 n=1 Tax=Erpetoichthys calabaricus TaxID=27687 RepID=A0A8C4S0P2_ERPCA|nr:COMM domain-containing protein 10 [Erpetoichthys calabaricus]
MASIIKETQSIKEAVVLINGIDSGKFPRLLSRILQRLHLKVERSFSDEEEEKLQMALSLEKSNLHLVIETVSFILEQAVYHNIKPASLQQQLENIHLSPEKAEAFTQIWATSGQESIEKFRQRMFAPKKLESIGWQLSLQMSQSSQAKVKSPCAVLELGINSEDSEDSEKMFLEFDHNNLLHFYNKLETIQSQLDSLT